MRNRTATCFFLATALLLASAIPAAAQGKLGVGVSFLGDEGGTGVAFDYSRPFRTLTGDRTLGWVIDLGFHRKSFDDDVLDLDSSVTSVLAQGGVRLNGRFNEKLTWHGQGLIGIWRSSFSSDITDEICDVFDVDCDTSSTDVVFTPGAGVDYALTDRMNLRAQLDIPITGDGSTTRFWFGLSWLVGQ